MTANLRALERSKAEIFEEKYRRLDAGTRKLSEQHSGHIVAILPRGEAIRNFVYTGALDEISQETKVTLLTVLPNEELRELFLARYDNLYELQEFREKRIVESLREVLDMAHGRWLWSEAAQERWRLRDAEAKPVTGWMKRQAKKMACFPFASQAGLNFLSQIERRASQWLRTTSEYVELFKKIKPSLVFNGSHVHSRVAMQAVQAAQWLGIPTATFIFSWDNLTSQGRIIPLYDYYLVWSEAIRDQLLHIYSSIQPEQVFVTGTPQFDFHFRPEFQWSREQFCARTGADPARPIALYSTGMANHMPGEPEIVKHIAAILREMSDFGPPQLMVRVYPKDRTGRFEQLKKDCPDVLFPEVPWEPAWLTPKMEDAYLLSNTLKHAAVGINVASTISLELCMFDKPVINVGYNPPGAVEAGIDYARYYQFDHYHPVVESGAVEVAYSQERLRASLIDALRRPERRSEQRKALIRQFFSNSLDGWSSTRVANVLELLVAKNGAQGRNSARVNDGRLDFSMDHLKR